jgi:hypothetical protein
MIIFLRSFFALLPIRLSFKVTPKSLADDVYQVERREMRIYMVLLGSLVGITASGILGIQDALASGTNPGLLGIAVIWACFNCGIILLAVRDVLVHRHERKHYRFPFKTAANLLENGEAVCEIEVDDISLAGLSAKAPLGRRIPKGKLAVRFEAPNKQQITIPLVKAEVEESGRFLIAQFGALAPKDRRALVSMLIVSFPARLPNRGYVPNK